MFLIFHLEYLFLHLGPFYLIFLLIALNYCLIQYLLSLNDLKIFVEVRSDDVLVHQEFLNSLSASNVIDLNVGKCYFSILGQGLNI